jgi:hypothetical protein
MRLGVFKASTNEVLLKVFLVGSFQLQILSRKAAYMVEEFSSVPITEALVV